MTIGVAPSFVVALGSAPASRSWGRFVFSGWVFGCGCGVVCKYNDGDGRRNGKVCRRRTEQAGRGGGVETEQPTKQNHARVESAPTKTDKRATAHVQQLKPVVKQDDNNGKGASPFVCRSEESSSNLSRAVRRTHHHGDMESSEAPFVPLVDQLPRVHRAVQEGGDPPRVPLQGGLD